MFCVLLKLHELAISFICRPSSDEENSEKESSDEQHLDSDEIGKCEYFGLKLSCGIAAGLNFLFFFRSRRSEEKYSQ